MKKIKKLSVVLAMIIIISSMTFYTVATEEYTIYEEKHEELDLKNLILTKNNDEINVGIKDCNFISEYFAKKRKKEVENTLDKIPKIEKSISQELGDAGELCAMSYTDFPLVLNDDGEWVRKERERKQPLLMKFLSLFSIKAHAAVTDGASSGNPSVKADGNFQLTTAIIKYDDGTYATITYATWDKGSWVGGENYPASEMDHIAQLLPPDFVIYADEWEVDSLYTKSAEYDDSKTYSGVNGRDHSLNDIGLNYIDVEIKDDPFGMDRLVSCFLTTRSKYEGTAKGTKIVKSYYLHTWSTISAEIGVTTTPIYDNSAHEWKDEYELVFQPVNLKKSWQVCNAVNFNF